MLEDEALLGSNTLEVAPEQVATNIPWVILLCAVTWAGPFWASNEHP